MAFSFQLKPNGPLTRRRCQLVCAKFLNFVTYLETRGSEPRRFL